MVHIQWNTTQQQKKKNNEIMAFAATWMRLEILMSNEVSQKDKYHMISHIVWNLYYGTNEPIYKTGTDSQT